MAICTSVRSAHLPLQLGIRVCDEGGQVRQGACVHHGRQLGRVLVNGAHGACRNALQRDLGVPRCTAPAAPPSLRPPRLAPAPPGAVGRSRLPRLQPPWSWGHQRWVCLALGICLPLFQQSSTYRPVVGVCSKLGPWNCAQLHTCPRFASTRVFNRLCMY
jgi:hypothetical protein